DREPARVQEILDPQQDLHLFGAVHAVPRPVLARAQHAELRLPVAQDVWLDPDQLGHLADRTVGPRVEDVVPLQHVHRISLPLPNYDSLRRSRAMSASKASRGPRPSNISAHT